MEFDWIDSPCDLRHIPPREIEESFEDPFSIRIMPEISEDSSTARYYALGKSMSGRGLFTVFWTDGKKYRVIAARDMSPEEQAYYERKNAELL